MKTTLLTPHRGIFGQLLFFLLLTSKLSQGQCTVDMLNISTGVNQQTLPIPTELQANQPDPYWAIVGAPMNFSTYTIPVCATSWGPAYSIFSGASTPISIENTGQSSDANMSQNCNNSNQPYQFQRKFKIATSATGTLFFSYDVDDHVESATLSGPPGFTTLNLNSNPCPNNGIVTVNTSVNFIPGVYTLTFNVSNYYLFGIWGNINNPTPMRFELEGFVSTLPVQAIVDNNHFGQNTIYQNPQFCSTVPYLPLEFGVSSSSACVATGNLHTFNLNDFYNGPGEYSYSVTGPGSPSFTNINMTNNTADLTVGPGQYIITSTDAYGCTYSTSVAVHLQPNLVLNYPPCGTTGISANVYTTQTSGGTPPYSFYNITTSSNINTNPFPFPLPANSDPIYVIQVTDANSCTVTSSVNIKHVGVSITASPQSICLNQQSTLTANTTVSLGSTIIGYSWNPGGSTTNPITVSPPSSTNYFVTVTSSDNCTAVSSIPLVVNPLPTVSITSNSQICSPTLTATASNGSSPYSYTWVGTPNFSYIQQSVTPILTQPPFTGTFTITAVDANGCSGSTNYFYTQNPFCCGASNSNQIFQQPGTKTFSSSPNWGNNGSATSVISSFGSSIISTSNNIIFDGSIVIDQSITFDNCSNLYFTANTKIDLLNGATLTFTNCVLQSLCDFMWKGIYVNNSSQSVTLFDCTIKDMSEGINSKNGGYIRLESNDFIDNYRGVFIDAAPSNFDAANGCIIYDNLFTSSSNSLKMPFNGQSKSEIGIEIRNSKSAQIGSLSSYTTGNIFRHLFNGILIRNAVQVNGRFGIYDNYFDDIKNLNSGNTPEYTKMLGWANVVRGAGIYCTLTGASLSNTSIIDVDYSDSDNLEKFNECDKAILGSYFSATVHNTWVLNSLMGFLFNNSTNKTFRISYCHLQDFAFGIHIYGNTNFSQLSDNILYSRNTPINGASWQVPIYPDIIKYWCIPPVPSNSGIMTMDGNYCNLQTIAGRAFALFSTNSNTRLQDNYIDLSISTPSWSPYSGNGISLENGNGTYFIGNQIIGNNSLLSVNNQMHGMILKSSPNCHLECNLFKKIRMGLHVQGGCYTGVADVIGNEFNQMGNGIRLTDIGSVTATLGNIGTLANDNGNIFNNASLFTPPFNFSMYRQAGNSSSPGNYYHLTGSAFAPTSGSNNLGAAYVPFTILPSSSYYQCPVSLMLSSNNNTANAIEHQGEEIVSDQIALDSLDMVNDWIEEKRLYHYIVADTPDILNSQSNLLGFYNAMESEPVKELVDFDKEFLLLHDSLYVSDSLNLVGLKSNLVLKNSLINATNSLLANEKWVNNILIKWWFDGTESLTNQELLELEEMSNACPFVKGSAVYKARSLYQSIHPEAIIDTRSICLSGVSAKNMESEPEIDLNKITNSSPYKIYPNPVADNLQIEWNLNGDSSGVVQLVDLTGNILLDIAFNPGYQIKSIDLSALNSGIYLIRFSSNRQTIGYEKIIKR